MQNRYKYSIFVTLGLLVLTIIFLLLKYVSSPHSSLSDATEASDMDDTTHIPETASIKDSWLGQMHKASNQKDYFYAVSEIHVKLN